MKRFPRESGEVGKGAEPYLWWHLLAFSILILWVLFLLYCPGLFTAAGFLTLTHTCPSLPHTHQIMRCIGSNLAKLHCVQVALQVVQWTRHTRAETSFLFHTLCCQLGLLKCWAEQERTEEESPLPPTPREGNLKKISGKISTRETVVELPQRFPLFWFFLIPIKGGRRECLPGEHIRISGSQMSCKCVI